MRRDRYRIVIAFEADRDMVPGWGHQIEDWVALFTEPARRNSHYNVTTEIVEAEEKSA
jgi:hypothetical protein